MRSASSSATRAAGPQRAHFPQRLRDAVGVAACIGLLTAPGAAARAEPEDAPRSFAEALAAAGWQVEVLVDGSLVLTPAGAQPGAPAGTPTPAAESEDPGWRALESFGWRVETDADGATLLYPPGTVRTPAAMPPPPPASPETGSTMPPQPALSPPAADAKARLADELDALLAERGWRAEWAADGSLLLLPLRQATASAQPAAGFVPDAVARGQVELPLGNAAAVRRVAAAWIAAVGGQTLLPGQVYAVGEVYLVNVLDSAPPHDLRHQIAIHAADGRVVVLN